MKAKTIIIASFILLVLHALAMISSCGSMKKYKSETSEVQSSQTVQLESEAQTAIHTIRDIQKDWLQELDFSSATITRDTVILSTLSTRKIGSKTIRAQEREENSHREQVFAAQIEEGKTDIRNEKERDPPRLLVWLGLISLITIGLAWYLKKP